MPQDPFALNITITLLLLSVGMGMFIGSTYAYIRRKEQDDFYIGRTVFLSIVGLLISIWVILSF